MKNAGEPNDSMHPVGSRPSLPETESWRERLRHWRPALAYMALIFIVSSFEVRVPAMSRLPLKDKLVHFVEYLILGALCTHATLRTWPQRPVWRTVVLGAFLAAAFGVTDELHQAFVPGRSSDIADVYADTLGGAAGAVLAYLATRWRGRATRVR